MKSFKHFVITRFNLRLYAQDKKNVPTLTESWLKERFELFERYCFPSMAAQQCTDFTWLCLFDKDTSMPYISQIEEYKTRCPAFCPIFYDQAQTLKLAESLHKTISEIITEQGTNIEYVITTNLDNDDALSRHAVGKLQHEFINDDSSKKIYSLLYGYQYFAKTGFIIKMRYLNNHFLTLAEPYRKEGILETIISYRHTKAIKQLNTTYIGTTKGMWLEVVHHTNVSNDFRINSKVRYIAIFKKLDLSDFGLHLKTSATKQFFHNIALLPANFIGTGIQRLWTKKKRKKIFKAYEVQNE